MAFIDYYATLEIPKTADDKAIKKAYRKLARKYHPDLNPGDKEAERKFREINEANEVLSSAENRKKYDKYGKDWMHAEEFEKARQQQQQNQQRYYDNQGSSGTFEEGDYSSFFESMFGGQGRSQSVRFRGQDYHAELHLSMHDVYKTHKRTLTVDGKNIRLTIPAGVKNGQVIKIKGHGGQGVNGGPKGDLHIEFSIQNDTDFRRDNDDLYSSVDVDLYTAILGGELTVNTFDGKVKLNVAAGTKNGTKVKLKGKGFPVYKKEGKFGDLYITYQVDIPTKLTSREKELFEELSKLAKS